ncbi:MAG: hypothetical protein ACF8TS_06035 [Maioricimonas sp. JB049]
MNRVYLRLGLAAVVILGAIGAAKGRELYEVYRFAVLYRECEEYVETLRQRRPVDVPPEVWDEENFGVGIAVANVCFSTHHVPLPEMERFTAEFRQRMTQPVDLSTISWLWDRLAATGDHGEQYVEKWRPVFEESVAAVKGAARQRNPR